MRGRSHRAVLVAAGPFDHRRRCASGYNLTGVGMELDAIAVVIGGTLLTGDHGYVLVGSGAGVLVHGLIQVLNAREGLDPWWTRVAIGGVLLAFAVLQRVISLKKGPGAARARS